MTEKRTRRSPRNTQPAILYSTLVAALLIAVFGRPFPSMAAAIIVLALVADPRRLRPLLPLLPHWAQHALDEVPHDSD